MLICRACSCHSPTPLDGIKQCLQGTRKCLMSQTLPTYNTSAVLESPSLFSFSRQQGLSSRSSADLWSVSLCLHTPRPGNLLLLREALGPDYLGLNCIYYQCDLGQVLPSLCSSFPTCDNRSYAAGLNKILDVKDLAFINVLQGQPGMTFLEDSPVLAES